QRLPSGTEAIEVAIASSPIGNRESCPDGEIRSISERFAIQTLRSGPAAIPLGRKLRTGVRSPSDTTSAAAPETPTAQTWTFESAPNPTTHTRPSGPAEIAWPRAAAPATATSVTKPAVVIRATRPVPTSGNQRLPSMPTAMSPGRIVIVAAGAAGEDTRQIAARVQESFLTREVTAAGRKSSSAA